MEVGANEMEDDVLFADLSRQISLLIMDDDVAWELSSDSFQLQGFTRNSVNQSIPPPSQSCRRDQLMSKGTGVFIPKLSQPAIRRNNNYKQEEGGGRRRRKRLNSSSRSEGPTKFQ